MGFISVPLIFTRTTLGELELANRVVVPPMCTWFADPETNEVNDLHLVHYGALAMGGPGLIIFEGTSVEKSGCIAPNDCGLWNDSQMEGLKRITKLVHDLGCSKIGIQLAHAGRKALTKKINHPSSSPTTAAIRRTNTAVPAAEKGDVLTNTYCSVSAEDHSGLPPCVSSSSVPYDVGWRVPLEMSHDMFAHVRRLFVHAAQRAVAAGFDLIEIHNAHGYLLNQFTSPLVNKRTDEYGGSLENRCKFSLEVLADIKAAIPAHIPISVRISAVDWVEEGGWSIDDSIYFVRKLVENGADIVHVSSGGVAPNQKIGCAWGYQIELSRQLKAAIAGLKTIAVGGVTLVEDANDILNDGDADLVAVGREHLRDPYWTRHQAEALGLPHWYPAYQILAYRKKPA